MNDPATGLPTPIGVGRPDACIKSIAMRNEDLAANAVHRQPHSVSTREQNGLQNARSLYGRSGHASRYKVSPAAY
jgi:hypothetical protein